MYEPGTFLWCTDHLDLGIVVRSEPMPNGETYLEVELSCGLTVVTGDSESHADYRQARYQDGIWEFLENALWRPIDFSNSELCPEPPVPC